MQKPTEKPLKGGMVVCRGLAEVDGGMVVCRGLWCFMSFRGQMYSRWSVWWVICVMGGLCDGWSAWWVVCVMGDLCDGWSDGWSWERRKGPLYTGFVASVWTICEPSLPPSISLSLGCEAICPWLHFMILLVLDWSGNETSWYIWALNSD